jgi:hypothetical protein
VTPGKRFPQFCSGRNRLTTGIHGDALATGRLSPHLRQSDCGRKRAQGIPRGWKPTSWERASPEGAEERSPGERPGQEVRSRRVRDEGGSRGVLDQGAGKAVQLGPERGQLTLIRLVALPDPGHFLTLPCLGLLCCL